MSRRFALVGLSSIFGFVVLGGAQGDQLFPSASEGRTFTSCHFGEGEVRCTHFEGYVVVRRHESATAATRVAKPDAVLSANRLYLPANDDKTP